ncbi:unnamed protein product, partial [Owenia fusiformis]
MNTDYKEGDTDFRIIDFNQSPGHKASRADQLKPFEHTNGEIGTGLAQTDSPKQQVIAQKRKKILKRIIIGRKYKFVKLVTTSRTEIITSVKPNIANETSPQQDEEYMLEYVSEKPDVNVEKNRRVRKKIVFIDGKRYVFTKVTTDTTTLTDQEDEATSDEFTIDFDHTDPDNAKDGVVISSNDTGEKYALVKIPVSDQSNDGNPQVMTFFDEKDPALLEHGLPSIKPGSRYRFVKLSDIDSVNKDGTYNVKPDSETDNATGEFIVDYVKHRIDEPTQTQIMPDPEIGGAIIPDTHPTYKYKKVVRIGTTKFTLVRVKTTIEENILNQNTPEETSKIEEYILDPGSQNQENIKELQNIEKLASLKNINSTMNVVHVGDGAKFILVKQDFVMPIDTATIPSKNTDMPRTENITEDSGMKTDRKISEFEADTDASVVQSNICARYQFIPVDTEIAESTEDMDASEEEYVLQSVECDEGAGTQSNIKSKIIRTVNKSYKLSRVLPDVEEETHSNPEELPNEEYTMDVDKLAAENAIKDNITPAKIVITRVEDGEKYELIDTKKDYEIDEEENDERVDTEREVMELEETYDLEPNEDGDIIVTAGPNSKVTGITKRTVTRFVGGKSYKYVKSSTNTSEEMIKKHKPSTDVNSVDDEQEPVMDETRDEKASREPSDDDSDASDYEEGDSDSDEVTGSYDVSKTYDSEESDDETVGVVIDGSGVVISPGFIGETRRVIEDDNDDAYDSNAVIPGQSPTEPINQGDRKVQYKIGAIDKPMHYTDGTEDAGNPDLDSFHTGAFSGLKDANLAQTSLRASFRNSASISLEEPSKTSKSSEISKTTVTSSTAEPTIVDTKVLKRHKEEPDGSETPTKSTRFSIHLDDKVGATMFDTSLGESPRDEVKSKNKSKKVSAQDTNNIEPPPLPQSPPPYSIVDADLPFTPVSSEQKVRYPRIMSGEDIKGLDKVKKSPRVLFDKENEVDLRKRPSKRKEIPSDVSNVKITDKEIDRKDIVVTDDKRESLLGLVYGYYGTPSKTIETSVDEVPSIELKEDPYGLSSSKVTSKVVENSYEDTERTPGVQHSRESKVTTHTEEIHELSEAASRCIDDTIRAMTNEATISNKLSQQDDQEKFVDSSGQSDVLNLDEERIKSPPTKTVTRVTTEHTTIVSVNGNVVESKDNKMLKDTSDGEQNDSLKNVVTSILNSRNNLANVEDPSVKQSAECKSPDLAVKDKDVVKTVEPPVHLKGKAFIEAPPIKHISPSEAGENEDRSEEVTASYAKDTPQLTGYLDKTGQNELRNQIVQSKPMDMPSIETTTVDETSSINAKQAIDDNNKGNKNKTNSQPTMQTDLAFGTQGVETIERVTKDGRIAEGDVSDINQKGYFKKAIGSKPSMHAGETVIGKESLGDEITGKVVIQTQEANITDGTIAQITDKVTKSNVEMYVDTREITNFETARGNDIEFKPEKGSVTNIASEELIKNASSSKLNKQMGIAQIDSISKDESAAQHDIHVELEEGIVSDIKTEGPFKKSTASKNYQKLGVGSVDNESTAKDETTTQIVTARLSKECKTEQGVLSDIKREGSIKIAYQSKPY